MSTTTYEAFVVASIGAHGICQGQSPDGKLREFALVVHRDVETGELSLDVARHFTDPTALAAFPGSQPWRPDELPEEER